LLAVLLRKASGNLKIFLWNRESETWLAGLDITHIIPIGLVKFFTISRNLLAVTVEGFVGAGFKTFFWRLDTRYPDASSPQFLGIVTGNLGETVFSVNMNEKWIVICCSNGIQSIEKTRLCCGDQDLVAVEAQLVTTELPQNPWQRVQIFYVMNASLEPGMSNQLAVKGSSLNSSKFLILNLATG